MPTAVERAMGALTRINDIGFPEFTAKLVNDTVDSVVGATIRQLKSYAELVAEVGQGLQAFVAKAVSPEAVQQYLKDAFPTADGNSTAVVVNGTYDKQLYQEITGRFGAIDGLADPGEGTATFSQDNVDKITAKVQGEMNKTATVSFNALKTMVEMGYARVIFTDGHIRTKLTFDVTATDSSRRSSSDIAQSAFQASMSMRGSFLSAMLGISGGVSYRNLHVRTVNEQSAAATTVSADIIGEVQVNFATQAFPSQKVEQPAPAPQPPK